MNLECHFFGGSKHGTVARVPLDMTRIDFTTTRMNGYDYERETYLSERFVQAKHSSLRGWQETAYKELRIFRHEDWLMEDLQRDNEFIGKISCLMFNAGMHHACDPSILDEFDRWFFWAAYRARATKAIVQIGEDVLERLGITGRTL